MQPKSPTHSHPILTRQLSLPGTSEMISLNRAMTKYSSQTSGEPPNPHIISTRNCLNPIGDELQKHQISLSSSSSLTPFIVPANSYEIILLADVRENFG